MVDKELIENWRNMLKPSISSRLLKTNYEGKGEQDKEEFERDFDEILDLALIGLKCKHNFLRKAQQKTQLPQLLPQPFPQLLDTISRQAAIDAINSIDNLDAKARGGICFKLMGLPPTQPEWKWIPCSERLPEDRVSVIVCFREWQQYAKRYVYSIVVGWYARKHSVHENVFSDWEADCEYDEIEDESYINEGWYEFTTQGNGDLMNWYINADVIAWMELPEPYQEGEQDE